MGGYYTSRGRCAYYSGEHAAAAADLASNAAAPAIVAGVDAIKSEEEAHSAAEGDAADPGGLLRASLAGGGEYQWTGMSAPGKKDSSAARRLLRALRPLTQRALREARVTQPESDAEDSGSEDSDE